MSVIKDIMAARAGEKVPVTEETYWYYLEILPPVFMFGVVKGELADYGFAEGANEIIAFRKEGKKYNAWRTGVMAPG